MNDRAIRGLGAVVYVLFLAAGGVAYGQPKLESVCRDANPLMEMLIAGKFQWNTVFEPDKETPGLFKRMLDGPLAGVEEIVFAVRGRSKDYHYYASQGNYYQDAADWQYGVGGAALPNEPADRSADCPSE